MRHLTLAISFILTLLVFTPVLAEIAGPELMPNAQLSTTDGWVGTPGAAGTLPRVMEVREVDGGGNALHVVCDRDTKVLQEWPGTGVRSPLFATETGKTYRVSFRILAQNGSVELTYSGGAGSWARNIGQFGAFASSDPPSDWETFVEVVPETAGGPNACFSFTTFGGGSAEFDLTDISVKEVDRSPAAISAAWRSAFPSRDFVCWEQSSWVSTLRPTSMPPSGIKETRSIRAAMGRTEYESASFILTNLGDAPLDFVVKAECAGVGVTVREGYWVKQHDGFTVCDALLLREDGRISVPAMENREVWLTFKTTNAQPGTYKGRVVVSAAGKAEKTIPVEVKVYPVTLPDEKPLYTCFWDYIIAKKPGDSRAAAYVADMRDHYVTVAAMPQIFGMKVKDGKLEPTDYTVFDLTVKNYAKMKPKMFLFYWGTEGNFEPMTDPKFLSEEWKVLFKQWLGDWISHIKGLGITYDKFAMYPYDEHMNDKAPQLAQLIHEVDPKVLFYADAMGQSSKEIHAMKPYIDIWCPFLYDYLNMAPYDRQHEIKAESKKAFGPGRRAERFWTYANPPGAGGPAYAPPYRDYRLSVWKAWQLGMGGYGVWNYVFYLQTLNGGPMYWNPGGPNWQLVLDANAIDAPPNASKGESVIPTRRWEATREGIEDYTYLWMLQQAVKGGKLKDSIAAKRMLVDLPRELLKNPEDTWRADRAKENVLNVLAEVR